MAGLHLGLLAQLGNGLLRVLQLGSQCRTQLHKARKACVRGKTVHRRLRGTRLIGNFIGRQRNGMQRVSRHPQSDLADRRCGFQCGLAQTVEQAHGQGLHE